MGDERGNFDLKTMTVRVGSGPLSLSPVRDKALLVKSGLSSSFDRNFLVVLLYYILVKWVRCHLDLIEVEVIETSNLATVPSRHVSGYMANC